MVHGRGEVDMNAREWLIGWSAFIFGAAYGSVITTGIWYVVECL